MKGRSRVWFIATPIVLFMGGALLAAVGWTVYVIGSLVLPLWDAMAG